MEIVLEQNTKHTERMEHTEKQHDLNVWMVKDAFKKCASDILHIKAIWC